MSRNRRALKYACVYVFVCVQETGLLCIRTHKTCKGGDCIHKTQEATEYRGDTARIQKRRKRHKRLCLQGTTQRHVHAPPRCAGDIGGTSMPIDIRHKRQKKAVSITRSGRTLNYKSLCGCMSVVCVCVNGVDQWKRGGDRERYTSRYTVDRGIVRGGGRERKKIQNSALLPTPPRNEGRSPKQRLKETNS